VSGRRSQEASFLNVEEEAVTSKPAWKRRGTMLLDSGKDDVSNVDKVLWILGGEAKGENKP
jgi:hypothetical protein